MSRNRKRELLNTIKYSSLSGNKTNYVHCWKGTSYEHWRVLSDIVWKLISQGYEIRTEVEFKSGGRADIIAFNMNGDGFIIEVLHSEDERKFSDKTSKYPLEFEIVKVKTKEFDINLWDL